MIKIRSILFDIFFYCFSAFFLTIFLPFVLIFRRKAVLFIFKIWGSITAFALKYIVGLTFKAENLIFPKECIIACRHQSAWETILISYLFGNTFVVVKKELMRIPVYNLYVKLSEAIILDRGNAMSAARSLIQQAKEKRPLFIFPEGTRANPDMPVKCQHGIAILYKKLDLPVYPITLNSGEFWGRRSFIKKPGNILVKGLTPIQPGLSRRDFITALEKSLSS
jgi:1-acyl-sn-glycerol-3-phosphate acyltransferase